MKTYPIHIAFCINDAYAKYACVTIKSIVDNHPDEMVTIHVLSADISEKSKERLSESIIGAESHVVLVYYVVDDTKFEGLRVKPRWPICAWYRLALCEILPQEVHRVLYLDADTVVDANLFHLFQLDMENKSIAAVHDSHCLIDYQRPVHLGYDESKGYVCSGVLLMNLDYWRKHNLLDTLINWARNHYDLLRFPDQDTLNVVCQDSKIILPLNYGNTTHAMWTDKSYELYLDEIKECVNHPIIIHLTAKPWFRDTCRMHPQYGIWRRYNKKLKHPVKIVYREKGLIPLKIFVWNILHPMSVKKDENQTLSDVKRKISLYEHKS